MIVDSPFKQVSCGYKGVQDFRTMIAFNPQWEEHPEDTPAKGDGEEDRCLEMEWADYETGRSNTACAVTRPRRAWTTPQVITGWGNFAEPPTIHPRITLDYTRGSRIEEKDQCSIPRYLTEAIVPSATTT